MKRKALLITVGLVVGLAHTVVQWGTYAAWDRALLPGEVRTMPALWPVISFPAFPLYELLSGGDRNMFHSFSRVMLANSAAWGVVATVAFAILRGRKASR